ncbi:hypothetical protein ACIOUE_37755 [Streptomyces xanthochromogenes]|uniref:hypothetical protein n=1 Tax=Streptomyces xanthochromogenes TaxID=67384 RepID=UPI00380A5E8D
MTTRTTTRAATDCDDTADANTGQARQAQGDTRTTTRLRLEAAAARFRHAANSEPSKEE